MTGEFETETAEDVVRQQSFDVDGPIELDLGVGAGRVEVRLVDEPGVHVEVRHDPSSSGPLVASMSGLLTWVSSQFGDQLGEMSSAEAVRQTRIDLTGGRLVVRVPKSLPLRTVPIAVTVRAPAGSHVTTHSGSANVTVTGGARRLHPPTRSRAISAHPAPGPAPAPTRPRTRRPRP